MSQLQGMTHKKESMAYWELVEKAAHCFVPGVGGKTACNAPLLHSSSMLGVLGVRDGIWNRVWRVHHGLGLWLQLLHGELVWG